MTRISNLSLRHAKAGNEERSSYVPKIANMKGRFEASNSFNNHKSGANVETNSAEKSLKKNHPENVDFDPTNVIQIRSDTYISSGLNGKNLLKANRLNK